MFDVLFMKESELYYNNILDAELRTDLITVIQGWNHSYRRVNDLILHLITYLHGGKNKGLYGNEIWVDRNYIATFHEQEC